MRIPSAYWFGLTLLSGLLFLWCLVSAIEAETEGAAWVWGLIVFGLLLIIGAAMSLITFYSQGGSFGRSDVLNRVEASAPPRFDGASVKAGDNRRLAGVGEVPKPSSGRPLR